MRPHTEEKQSRKVRRSSNVKSQQDRSGGWGHGLHRHSLILYLISKTKNFYMFISLPCCSFRCFLRWRTFDKAEKKICNSWETREKSQQVNQIYWYEWKEMKLYSIWVVWFLPGVKTFFFMQLSGLIIDASSDNEPFSKIGAKVSKTAKKRVSVPPKKKKGNFLSIYWQHLQEVAALCSVCHSVFRTQNHRMTTVWMMNHWVT